MDFKTRLRKFYEIRCPSKCSDVNKLAIKYEHKEKDLFRQLTLKYGPENWLTNADKTAARKRTIKPDKPISIPTKKTIDVEEWMENLLTNEDHQLIKEIDMCESTHIPQKILDKI